MVNLEINDLSMRYEKKYILEDLRLNVEHGELLVLLGESGCGKTTLIKIIAGIIEPEKGKIIMEDEDITLFSPQRRKMGYVPQAQVLFPHMTVKSNISFGLKSHKKSKEEIKEKIRWVAELIQIEELLERYSSEISGGQKQRVALARAMAIEPHMLLLDEPLSSIDATGRESLALTIRRIQKETETTTIYVTHNQEEARLISDRVAVIYDGKVQQIGKVTEIDNSPKNYLIAKIMGSPNVWPIFYIKETDENTILNTTVGEIKLPKQTNKKITGISISPSCFKPSLEKKSRTDLEKSQFIEFKGEVKSMVQRDERTIRAVIELEGEKFDYAKIDVDKEDFEDILSSDQKIFLYVDTSEVNIL